jgi:hypothetical protein
MLQRCTNPKDKGYRRYGGRGISVCPRWKEFKEFWKDMGARPSKDYSLDRINNDGNYEPSNCRWATRVQQNRNRSYARPITVDGRTQLMADWARERGLVEATICKRLARGWSAYRAVMTPSLRTDTAGHVSS